MIEILDRKIGPEYLPYFIADIGANHDGELQRALELIEMAANVGVDAVKFQNFRAETIVSRRGFDELGKMAHQQHWAGSIYDEYAKASMPLEWIPEVSACCHNAGVHFLTTPYDLELVDQIDPYVPAWKIGSGDITWDTLIRHVASKGKPVFLATGASTADEVDKAIGYFFDGWPEKNEYGQHLVLMQCNTNYTGDPDNVRYLNLAVLDGWRENYYPLLGLSDHTAGHVAVIAALAKGACVFEKHFTDDRTRPGPDHRFAMEETQWYNMIEAANEACEMLGDGVKNIEPNERQSRIVQRRALRWGYDLPAGASVIPSRGDVLPTRPCPEGALEPYRLGEVVGRRLKRDVEADTLVRLEDFE